MNTVGALLDGYRSGTLDPASVLAGLGVNAGIAAEAARRWTAGDARALEGVPVFARDDAARVFAQANGAVAVDGASAPLILGGTATDAIGAAKADGVALITADRPTMVVPRVDDLAAVLGALGTKTSGSATRVARIEGLRAATDAARRADDLAASLLKGLGLTVEMLRVSGATRFGAASADADALLLPATAAMIEEARAAELAALALPGVWDKGGHLGVLIVGISPLALTLLGSRLSRAMGG